MRLLGGEGGYRRGEGASAGKQGVCGSNSDRYLVLPEIIFGFKSEGWPGGLIVTVCTAIYAVRRHG